MCKGTHFTTAQLLLDSIETPNNHTLQIFCNKIDKITNLKIQIGCAFLFWNFKRCSKIV